MLYVYNFDGLNEQTNEITLIQTKVNTQQTREELTVRNNANIIN